MDGYLVCRMCISTQPIILNDIVRKMSIKFFFSSLISLNETFASIILISIYIPYTFIHIINFSPQFIFFVCEAYVLCICLIKSFIPIYLYVNFVCTFARATYQGLYSTNIHKRTLDHDNILKIGKN